MHDFLPHSFFSTTPIVCDLGEWCGWSDCDCEKGAPDQTRVRGCTCPEGVECPFSPLEETQECPESSCRPACVWGEWCGWSDCSETCGPDGEQFRSRIPDDDSVDDTCPGDSIEKRPCNQVRIYCLP